MPFASQLSAWGGVLPCALSKLYLYCTTCHGTTQFVYKDCGTRTAMLFREHYTSVQQVYQNTVRIRFLPLGCCTAMLIIEIVHLLYEAPWDLTICAQRLCGPSYGNISQHFYFWNCKSAFSIFVIVHLLVEVSQHRTVCAQGLFNPYSTYVHHGGVRICTADVRNFHSSKRTLVSEVHSHASFRYPTPTVQGTTGTPNLCTKAAWALIRKRS